MPGIVLKRKYHSGDGWCKFVILLCTYLHIMYIIYTYKFMFIHTRVCMFYTYFNARVPVCMCKILCFFYSILTITRIFRVLCKNRDKIMWPKVSSYPEPALTRGESNNACYCYLSATSTHHA